jgi:hypothetical protein
VAEKVFDLLLDSVLSLGSFPLVAERSSFATSLSTTTPNFSELGLWLATTKNSSKMQGRGKKFFGST